MLTKKLLAIAAAATLAIPAFSLPASAANGDVITVGGNTVKLATDFNHLADGLRLGQGDDKVFVSADNDPAKSMDFHIADGAGVNGSKAVVFGVLPGVSTSGVFAGWQYMPKGDENGVLDFEGATDFVFWLDGTKDPNPEVSCQVVIQEWDYDDNGNPVMVTDPNTDQEVNQITARNLADDATTVFYTLEDGSSTWEEHTSTSQSWIKLPNTFKGYIRVPFDTFDTCWSTKDANGKFDLKHILSINFYNGLYPRHEEAGQSLTIDDIGFAGNFSGSGTTIGGGETTKAPAGTTTTKAATTTTKAAGTTTTTSKDTGSPKTGEMPITAALVTAMVFTGVLIASKKRSK